MRRVWLGLALLCAGCTHSSGSLELLPPFSDDTVIGELTASWRPGAETPATGGTIRSERPVEFRVAVQNRLSDRLYVALHGFRLITADGATAENATRVECALAPGENIALLTGTVWVDAGAATAIRGFRVEHLAVPLSERGRAFYREFLLLQHADAAAAIDAELTAEAAAAPCRAAD